jgi:hypothetical protein
LQQPQQQAAAAAMVVTGAGLAGLLGGTKPLAAVEPVAEAPAEGGGESYVLEGMFFGVMLLLFNNLIYEPIKTSPVHNPPKHNP